MPRALPVDLKGSPELHKLVRRAGLKIESSTGKALATAVDNLRDAYAYARASRHEFAKRRFKPLRDIAKHAATVAKKLDSMPAFQALVKAIEDVSVRDNFIRQHAPELAPNDLQKLSGGLLGPTAISFAWLPRSLSSFAEQAESVHQSIAAPARRPGRRAVETWRGQRLAYQLRRALRRHAPRVEPDSRDEKKWLACALEFCGCECPAWDSWRFKKFLIDDEPADPKSDHGNPPEK
jgi:hypothetical protein